MLDLGIRDATTGKDLGRFSFTTPPQNGDILEIEGTRYRLQRVWDDVGGLLLEAQREPRVIPLDLFSKLLDELRDVQLCDNTAREANEAWCEIEAIVNSFKEKMDGRAVE